MKDGVVGTRSTQLQHLGRDIDTAGRRHDFGPHLSAQLFRALAGRFDRITPELGIGVHESDRGAGALFGDVLQENAEHLGVVRSHEKLRRDFLGIVELGGERGPRHQDTAHPVEFGLMVLEKPVESP